MSEVLVATRKGLFVLQGEPGAEYEIAARAFAGQEVEFATRDPRTGRYLASVTSWFYGPRIWVTDDPAGEWEQASGTELPEGDDALKKIWIVQPGEADGVLWAGGDPGCLFRSTDGGATWELNRGLWDQPSRPEWQPGGGGLCLHTIVPWPGDPQRLLVAISAVGVWLTDDGGESWRHSNTGIVLKYLPDDVEEQPPHQHCVHSVRRSAAQPERLFMQFHNGVYRSDDAGATWLDIAEGLPSDFGFPIAVDPADADSAYLIPLVGAEDRTVPGGEPRVWETRDAGATWAPRGEGLPPREAWLTVLRNAFDTSGAGPSLELYFGATSGSVFGSGDAGASWFTVAEHLAPVNAVRAV